MSQNIQSQYFYHRTNAQEFALRQQENFYYHRHQSDQQGSQEYITPVETEIFYALLTGVNSCRTTRKKAKDQRIFLLAIPTEKYQQAIKIEFMCTGPRAVQQWKIYGKIALEDIVVVDSLEKFERICTSATKEEKKMFQKYYL